MIERILLEPNGRLDEVVATGPLVHLEAMDDRSFYLGIGHMQIWISSATPLKVHYELNEEQVATIETKNYGRSS